MEPIERNEITKIVRNWDKGGMYFTITFEVANEGADRLFEALKRNADEFSVNLWRDTSKPIEQGE